MKTSPSVSEDLNKIYRPIQLRLHHLADKKAFEQLIEDNHPVISDEIEGQIRELIKGRHPATPLKEDDYQIHIKELLNGISLSDYGVWVYYPWSNRMVHLLDEKEFIEVRTNRNQYKITRAERDLLSTKTVGIIGLSVGQSIALTLAMERSCAHLRLADFDALELSNLNRIRTGVHNLGVPKVSIAAREIAEMDPFIQVKCFFDGLTDQNMEQFFLEDGPLDILVDECDGLDVKILARYKARSLKIPVIMDTSDRGMLDIERFDLEPQRPILHGMAEGLNPDNIKEISNEDKVPIVLQMLGAENISVRAKASMVEVQQSINTWPQLASSVALGGAAGADTCRRILLSQLHVSGRFYVDFEEIIKEDAAYLKPLAKACPAEVGVPEKLNNPFNPLTSEQMRAQAEQFPFAAKEHEQILSNETVKDLVSAACAAPSTGNDQPWKWLYHEGALYLFHDQYRSFSFGDFRSTASYISFGGAFENLNIHALKSGYGLRFTMADPTNHPIVSVMRFHKLSKEEQDHIAREDQKAGTLQLDRFIYERITNRNPSQNVTLPETSLAPLIQAGGADVGAEVRIFTDPRQIEQLGEIIGFCDRVRLLDINGHYDFVHREMRWTPEDTLLTRDGIDIQTLGLSNAQLAALNVIKSEQVIQTLNDINGGGAMEALAHRMVKSASALCLITYTGTELESYFKGGRAMERFWLTATGLGLAVHPLISPLYLFSRLVQGKGEGLDPKFIPGLNERHRKFQQITGMKDTDAGVFLTKIAVAPPAGDRSLRLPLDETLFFA